MTELDRDLLRKLTEWSSNGTPVTTVYLDVDGRRYPRRQDYMVRAEEAGRQLRAQAQEFQRGARLSAEQDVARVLEYLERLDRGPSRGVALFSCAHRGLWEEIGTPRPVRDRVALADRPYVLPLEALVETYQSFCTVIVDRERARIFLARMGRIREETQLVDHPANPGDQDGWSHDRYQRRVDGHVLAHLKHVSDVLLDYFKRTGFDHLIVAGPNEVVGEFERHLHDYLRRRIVDRGPLAMTVPSCEVLERSMAVEEGVEERRERRVMDRVLAEAAAGRHAVTDLGPVLEALNDGRVDTLVVPMTLEAGGARCRECGRLAERGTRCRTCGGPMERVRDVVENAVAAAIRQSARVETLSASGGDRIEQPRIGALLRF